MKNHLSKFSMFLIIFFIANLILIFTFSYLQYRSLISPLVANILNALLSLLLFFVISLYVGFKINKKGWLIGLILSIIYFIILSIIIGVTKEKLDVITIVLIILRILCIFCGSIIGVNLKKD
ncbi:MAG: TIGR04086 family membrane protein [Bacilli bacterium]